MSHQQISAMQKAMERSGHKITGSDQLLREDPKTNPTRVLRIVSALVLPAVAIYLFFTGAVGWGFAALGGAAVFTVGMLWGSARSSPPLTARGTAIREQAEGFRHYLRTAENHQLRFEADQDVFSRYLPWAVLFKDEKRWSRACEEMAAQGRIASPRTDIVVGATSISQVTRAVGGLSGSVSPRSSGGGGSGGSSGFSGGSSGGGGGGGTSASSW